MELTWKASEPANALYAASCLSAGLPVADARLAEAFAPAVEMVLAEFEACQAPADRLLPILTGLAARGVDDNRQLVEQAITKLVGSRSPLSCIGRTTGRGDRRFESRVSPGLPRHDRRRFALAGRRTAAPRPAARRTVGDPRPRHAARRSPVRPRKTCWFPRPKSRSRIRSSAATAWPTARSTP